jgi:hypothetical protein
MLEEQGPQAFEDEAVVAVMNSFPILSVGVQAN